MNIYVGNLSYDMTEEDLRKEFEAFGKVDSVNIIKDKFTDRSRGFAFVEMSSAKRVRPRSPLSTARTSRAARST